MKKLLGILVLGLLWSSPAFSNIISCVGINTPNQNFKISKNKITAETVEFELIGMSEGKAEGQFTIYKGFFNKKIVSSNTILINLKSNTAELTSYKDWVDGMATKVDILQYRNCKDPILKLTIKKDKKSSKDLRTKANCANSKIVLQQL